VARSRERRGSGEEVMRGGYRGQEEENPLAFAVREFWVAVGRIVFYIVSVIRREAAAQTINL